MFQATHLKVPRSWCRPPRGFLCIACRRAGSLAGASVFEISLGSWNFFGGGKSCKEGLWTKSLCGTWHDEVKPWEWGELYQDQEVENSLECSILVRSQKMLQGPWHTDWKQTKIGIKWHYFQIWALWHAPVMLAFGRWRQKSQGSKSSSAT